LLLTLLVALWSGFRPLHASVPAVSRYGPVNFTGGVHAYPDMMSGSTGFTSIATARALFKAPRWIAATQDPPPIQAQAPSQARLALAVLGMPVDVGHVMLRGTISESDCLPPGQTVFGPCQGATETYERIKASNHFNLCDFDEDCWHSTAVALVAVGNAAQTNPILWPGQQASAEFHSTTFGSLARGSYADYADSGPGRRYAGTYQAFLRKRFPGFAAVMNVAIPVANVPLGGALETSTYLTKQMMFDRGVDPGAPVLALNVFENVDSDRECDQHHKTAPCLLTTDGAQEQALRDLLSGLGADGSYRGFRLGAIVVVAGGALTAARCDDTPFARLIAQLRRRGVLTFVAAGNDSDPTRVRFPACASQAIPIGSLTRDGAMLPASNGNRTGLVSLYVDGDTVAMPIRGPRVQDAPPGSGADCGSDCQFRDTKDQYDVYLAGGTLLSTGVAAGVYLDLRQRFPSAAPEEVLAALHSRRLASNQGLAEVDERAAAQILAARAHH